MRDKATGQMTKGGRKNSLWFKYKKKRNKTGSFRKQQESVETTGTKKKSETLHLMLLNGQ